MTWGEIKVKVLVTQAVYDLLNDCHHALADLASPDDKSVDYQFISDLREALERPEVIDSLFQGSMIRFGVVELVPTERLRMLPTVISTQSMSSFLEGLPAVPGGHR